MKHALAIAATLLFAVGCGDSQGSGTTDPPTTPPPENPGPAEVMILEASAAGDGAVNIHLHNDGRPGAFKLEFYGLPTSPNGPDTFFGAAEAVEVATGYDETVTYTVNPSPSDPPVEYVLAFSRDQGSAAYHQSDRFDFP